jgi:hypothetical protein
MRWIPCLLWIALALAGPSAAGQKLRVEDTCRYGQLSVPTAAPRATSSTLAAPGVRVLYFLPIDRPWTQSKEDLIVQASRDVQTWYAHHTDDGRTFVWGGNVERVSGSQASSYYNADLWGRVLSELSSRGYPIWQAQTVFQVWVDGAGRWAGGSTFHDWAGVSMLGAEGFIQVGCVPTHPSNWPCTPAGAMAHEIGHAFGMPHPDTAGAWPAGNLNDYTVMGSQWNFPVRESRNWTPRSPWGLLNYERDHLRYHTVLSQKGVPYPPLPDDPMEKPALPDPALVLSVERSSPRDTRLTWSANGAFEYHAYWSTSPTFSTYAAVSGSPTIGTSLAHSDAGQPSLFFQLFEIPLSD